MPSHLILVVTSDLSHAQKQQLLSEEGGITTAEFGARTDMKRCIKWQARNAIIAIKFRNIILSLDVFQ